MATPTQLNENKTGIINQKADICTTSLPNYEVLRQQNLTLINNYYNDLLAKYTQSYNNYVKNSSSNASDRSYAETQLKPATVNYNNQMIALTQKMINNVNDDNNNILQLKSDLDSKKNQIEKLNTQIHKLKSQAENLETQFKSKNDNLNSTYKGQNNISIWNWVFIVINIILLICILCGVGYLLFSKNDTNSTTGANNTTSTNMSTNTKVNSSSNPRINNRSSIVSISVPK